MIVLDEQLNDNRIISSIGNWYKGKVVVINDLRPNTLIKDDNIPQLLLTVSQPTFVTINYRDFWQIISAHKQYCVVCFYLSSELTLEISDLLRELFQLKDFKTKNARMGKVISVKEIIDWYEN